jgi:diguanylate cyclase (GGDEF)-like protein
VPSQPRRRPPLTRYFAVVSVVAMLVLGVALALTTTTIMRRQALAQAVEQAEHVEAHLHAALPVDAYRLGLVTPDERAALGRSLEEFAPRLVALRLWTVNGEVLYDPSSAEPTGFPDTARLDAAVQRGATDARIGTFVPGGAAPDPSVPGAPEGRTELDVISVYVPITYDEQRVGAAEVVLDHSATIAALRTGIRTVTLVTVTGLALLWLLLFRVVRTFSSRLQSNALENARLALLDALTGLPNRRMLRDRLDRAVTAARQDGTGVGLVLLDVDRFKDINDSLGHDRGDVLLEQVARRLEAGLREGDIVARLGGDEFAILLPSIGSIDVARRLAERVRGVFVAPFDLGEIELHVETSIGVACLPEHAGDASSLMRRADVAMYTAKAHRLGVAVYSPDEDDSSPARLVLLGDLHRALERPDEMTLHYQPKIDLGTGLTVGVEALMRWDHPTRGTLGPNLFVPLAEQTGLITTLTRFALVTAIQQVARWRDAGEALPVAVNLSAHNVTSLDVVDLIEQLLATYEVPASLLQVEITETALVSAPSRVVPVLERLQTIGVKVAIDDFGIGNTSISQLRDLPVSQLKIDRLFVQDLASGHGKPGSTPVVRAMVDLAHSFGLTVVAEGVEDAVTAGRLAALGVDQAQGYLYSRAVPADAVAGVRTDLVAHRPAVIPPVAAPADHDAGSADRATPIRSNLST